MAPVTNRTRPGSVPARHTETPTPILPELIMRHSPPELGHYPPPDVVVRRPETWYNEDEWWSARVSPIVPAFTTPGELQKEGR